MKIPVDIGVIERASFALDKFALCGRTRENLEFVANELRNILFENQIHEKWAVVEISVTAKSNSYSYYTADMKSYVVKVFDSRDEAVDYREKFNTNVYCPFYVIKVGSDNENNLG